MRKFFLITFVLIASAIVLPSALSAARINEHANQSVPHTALLSGVAAKIDKHVLQTLQKGEATRTLIVMAEQADVSAANNLKTKQEKGRYVFDTLRATADRTQAGVRAQLDQLGLSYRAYYVANVIAVENLDANAAFQIAARPEVGHISANPDVHFIEPVSRGPSTEAAAGVEWGVQKIRAPKLWDLKFKGKGIVVANQDTGVQWTHPALKNRYRGYTKKTGAVDHSYNWWDAIHNDIDGNSNPCGYNSAKPCDDNDHGTHTMGTMVGKAGANEIGVAPRAKWISCRNMDSGTGRPSAYIECFQFFLAPWDKDGNNPDPAKAPDVVSNSWGCPPSEQCNPDDIKAATENVRAAGIFVSVSAGNSGSACETVEDPPAIYDASTTVGATDIGDALANFSSRGLVTVDSSNLRKPDISAPGVNVRSSVPNNSYANFSGTSMAAPHVAGAVALLWDAIPSLRGDVDATETAFFNSAKRSVKAGNQVCGGTSSANIPNNLFGYGRLDVWKAYKKSLP